MRVSTAGITTPGQGVILRAQHRLSDDRTLCVWCNRDSQNDLRLDAGVIIGNAVISWIGLTGPLILSPDCWLEWSRAGGLIEIRVWAASGARPDTATYTHADDGMVGDAFGLSTIGSPVQVVTEIRVS